MANRDTAKGWFKTGDKPTQAQFEQLFNWLFFNDDGIDMDAVAGLTEALQAKANAADLTAFIGGELVQTNIDYAYNLLQGYLLEKIIVLPGADTSLRIGFTVNGNEVNPDEDITTDGEVFDVNIYAKAATTIYFTGLNAGSKIILLKRLVKTQ